MALRERGYSKLKDIALDRTVWITGFGVGYGPVVRHYGMNELIQFILSVSHVWKV